MRAVESAPRIVDSMRCIDSSVLLVSSNDKKMLPFFKISLPPPVRVDRPYPRLAQVAPLSFGSVWGTQCGRSCPGTISGTPYLGV
jgi:hypothetical protein